MQTRPEPATGLRQVIELLLAFITSQFSSAKSTFFLDNGKVNGRFDAEGEIEQIVLISGIVGCCADNYVCSFRFCHGTTKLDRLF